MEKAKAILKDFGHRDGHHDTTVEETVRPAVTHETIKRVEKEQVIPAVDREVHQHHFHTSVQPVQAREVVPEEHHHKAVAVEHREHHHGDHEAIKARLQQEAAQFTDRRVEAETEHQRTVMPVITGEHRHHHVHETIQPVVQKETIQPVVVHTTVPVHEIHHKAPEHHTASALPPMSIEEFKAKGGVLEGKSTATREAFEGEPRTLIGGHHSGDHHHHSGLTGTSGTTGTTGMTGTTTNTTTTTTGTRY